MTDLPGGPGGALGSRHVLGAGQAGPCVLAMVERKTGYVPIGKLPIRRAAEVNARASRPIRAQTRPVRTITAENGTEFNEYAASSA